MGVPLSARIEALVLAAPEPLSEARMRELLGCSSAELRAALAELAAHYADRGLRLEQAGGGWRFVTAPDCAEDVRRLLGVTPPRLSRAALETLAIIAYRQPTTRAEIEAIRGVRTSAAVLGALIERGWVRVVGRKDVPGRPLLYGTTRRFLADFGLASLDALPEAAELLDDEAMAQLARQRAASGAGADGSAPGPLQDEAEDGATNAQRG